MLISVEVLLPSFNNSQDNLVTEKQILYLLQQGTSGVEFVLFSIRKGFSANSPLCVCEKDFLELLPLYVFQDNFFNFRNGIIRLQARRGEEK